MQPKSFLTRVLVQNNEKQCLLLFTGVVLLNVYSLCNKGTAQCDMNVNQYQFIAGVLCIYLLYSIKNACALWQDV